MSLVLNTNIDSLVAQNSLTTSSDKLSSSLQQLSTGMRINNAADDAAGFAIVQGMTSQINGMNQAEQNANDGVSLAQTASGALTEITNDLQSMRDLAVESLNATNSASDRTDLNQQFQQLMADINNVAQTTSFNGVNLLDGTFQGATFQVGANAGQTISVSSVTSAQANNLGNVYAGTVSAANDSVTLATGGTYGPAAAGTAGSYTAGTAASDLTLGGVAQSSINGDSVVLKVKVNGTEYDTSAIALTGTASADLKSIAAGINQAISSVGGVVATVNSAGTGISFSATTGANQGVIVETSVGSATDSNGNALTVGTGTAKDLGLDGADTIGTYQRGSAAATTTTKSTLSSLDVSTVDDANKALISIDSALQQIASTGAQLGAYQNRFQAAATGLSTDVTNLSSARSDVQDTDYAQATSQLSQAQILQQASTAMIAQANTIPQNVLTLLQKLP
ncbi:MAG TPA: flagellin [Steroidobacteraceae bacterium]|nr:flagellin [Steroidobacteraceae bacterium]